MRVHLREEDLNKKIVKWGLVYENIILSINTSSSVGKVAFGLVMKAKSEDFPEENCKVAWDRLVGKYAPQTASSLLKLKSEFHNSRDPDEWISHLEGLRTHMNAFQ